MLRVLGVFYKALGVLRVFVSFEGFWEFLRDLMSFFGVLESFGSFESFWEF